MALQATLGSIMVYKGNLFSGRSTCSYMVLCPCLEFGDEMLYTCSSFFNLLQNLATFVKASYKRMAVWIAVVGKQLGKENMKRLKLIGETWRPFH